MTDLIIKNSLFSVNLNKLASKYKYKDTPIIIELCFRYLQSKFTEMINSNNRVVGTTDITQLFSQCKELFKFDLSQGKNKELAEQWIQKFGKSHEYSPSNTVNDNQIQNLFNEFSSSNLSLEFVFFLVNLYLERLPSSGLISGTELQNDLIACKSKIEPIMILLDNLNSVEIRVIEKIIKTLHLVSKNYQSLSNAINTKDTGNKNINDHQFIKILADRYYEIFFGSTQNQILKKSLSVLINEYPVIFQQFQLSPTTTAVPTVSFDLISGEEIQFGPISFVKLQIIEVNDLNDSPILTSVTTSGSSSSSTQVQQPGFNSKLRCITLGVSNFRLIYRSPIKESQDYTELYGLPLSSIQLIKKQGRFIKIQTKHSKIIFIGFNHKSDETLFLSVIDKLSFHKPIKSIFSFQNTEDTTSSSSSISTTTKQVKSSSSKNTSNINNDKVETYWNLLSLEYNRFGVNNISLPPSSSSKDKSSNSSSNNNSTSPYWRISQCNNRLDVCQTYPNSFMIPKSITDSQMKEFSHFRVSKRFPLLSWVNPSKPNVFVSISHPPRIDYLTVTASVFGSDDEEDEDEDEIRNKNVYDYTLIDEYYKISNIGIGGTTPPNKLLIFDTGPVPKNPYDSFYKICKFNYLSLSTHETNKSSYQKLIDLCTSSTSLEHTKWLQLVENTGWIEIIRGTLRNTMKIVEQVIQGRSVIIQSSDGHDFDELLLSSLVQIIMDPFYRTLKGLQRLIQKEWCEFGYPFGRHFTTQERSNLPISFIIFMDSLSQLLAQYPIDFEYNEKSIRFITEEIFNGRFGNFISKSLKDAESLSIQNNTISIWFYMNNIKRNPTKSWLNSRFKDYSKSNLPIKIFNVDSVQFWSDFFLRWISIDGRIHALKTINLQLVVQNEINLSTARLFDLPIRLFKSHQQVIEKITKMHLPNNNLQFLPKSLLEFKGLKELILDNNLISHIPSHFYQLLFESLKSLEYLSMAQNLITSIPNEISLGGETIIRLNLQSNRISTISPHIEKLQNITTLNLSNNSITYFPNEFTSLISLRELDLSTNQIANIPFQISQLTSLKSLNLFDNKIARIPNHISDLKSLKYLNLNQNKVKFIESICLIGNNLEELLLDSNKISEIPYQIQRLESLRQLSLQNNRIQSLPDELMLLGELRILKIGQNQISWLPPTICQLEKLESLLLPNNQIDALPQTIGMLNSLTILDIEGNKLNKKLAKEIGVGGIKDILTQMKEFIEKIQPFGKSKMIVLGINHLKSKNLTNLLFHREKRSQKSHVTLNSGNESSSSSKSSTTSGGHALEIENIIIDSTTGNELCSWEFNNIYNQYQSLLFTEKTIYCVQFIFNPEDNGNSTLDYWLDLLCHRFSNNVKIYAIGFISSDVNSQLNDNSFDQWIKNWKNFNKSSVFVNRHIDFIFINQSTMDADVESLKDMIIESLPKKTMVNEMIPSPFSLLEQHLIEKRSAGVNFMQKDEIIELAQVFNIKGLAKIGNVLKYLENISTIIQFPLDSQYSNLIITNPQWFYQQLLQISIRSTPTPTPTTTTTTTPLAIIKKTELFPTATVGPGGNIDKLLNLFNRYNIISYIEPLGTMPIPSTTGLELMSRSNSTSDSVILNQHFDGNHSFDFLDEFIQQQPQDDVFIERYIQFQYNIPNHLFQELRFRLYQIAKLEFENTIEKKLLLISLEDYLNSENEDGLSNSGNNNRNNLYIRVYIQQIDSTNIKLILFGSNKKMRIIHDLYTKIQDILQVIMKAKYSFNSFQVLVPCIHANSKKLTQLSLVADSSRHFYKVEYCELAFLLGYNCLKCPQTSLDVKISVLAPDIAMTHFPGKLQERDVQFSKELGRGGFGVVYKGKFNEKDVAIKKLSIDNSRYLDSSTQSINLQTLNPDDEMDLIRSYRDFQREAYSLELYSKSKNVLKLLGIIISPPCLITEFLSKGDLDSYIKSNAPLPIQHAVRIALDIAVGMNEFHSHLPSHHHNDLKPPNILLNQLPIQDTLSQSQLQVSNNNQQQQQQQQQQQNIGKFNLNQPIAIIADLGTVYDSIHSRVLGRIVDNPIYLAPEILKGQYYDNRSDIYSFGVILYEMISKTKGYFSEITFFSGIEDLIVKGKRPPLPSITTDQQLPDSQNIINSYLSLLQQCWSQDPNQRPNFSKIIQELSKITSPPGGNIGNNNASGGGGGTINNISNNTTTTSTTTTSSKSTSPILGKSTGSSSGSSSPSVTSSISSNQPTPPLSPTPLTTSKPKPTPTPRPTSKAPPQPPPRSISSMNVLPTTTTTTTTTTSPSTLGKSFGQSPTVPSRTPLNLSVGSNNTNSGGAWVSPPNVSPPLTSSNGTSTNSPKPPQKPFLKSHIL